MDSRSEKIKQEQVGRTYGHLKLINYIPGSRRNGKTIPAKAEVKCLFCNNDTIKLVDYRHIITGAIISCGCYNKYRSTKHGLWKHNLYYICIGAIKRCSPSADLNHSNYRDYYSRGIRCFWTNETLSDFIKYLEENLPQRQKGQSLDRLDNNGNYEPGNLRWATATQQTNNRRKSIRN